ncbi:MAG: hypothetical protein ACTIMZ_15865 [Pseudoalteromonas distincta]|uniref:hypothetical protein n=1 Tax=Pseudoalteromonas distincta TaxID=77608 RepID=UPI000464357D
MLYIYGVINYVRITRARFVVAPLITLKNECNGTNRVAINARMVNSDIIKAVNIRYFDGANTFKYIEQ